MALNLVSFPTEVLACITFFLTDLEVLMRLPLCGDSKLTNKLKSGGVTHLFCELSSYPVDVVKFAHSLRLHSLETRHAVHPEQIRDLIHGAPSSIKHLEIYADDVGPLFETSDLDLDCAYSPVRYTSSRPWIVSSTFPQLETLIIDVDNRLKCLDDAVFFASWLRGLPTSLTTFRPSKTLRCGYEFSVWQHLPPNITQAGPLTWSARGAPRRPFESIQQLKITTATSISSFGLLPVSEHDKSDLEPRAAWDSEFEELSISALQNGLSQFPNLTRLSLYESDVFADTLPSTLTSLTWKRSTWRQCNLAGLLARVPPTIVHLKLKGISPLTPISEQSVSTQYPIFTRLKTFHLELTNDYDEDLDPQGEEVLSTLIKHLPIAESISLSFASLGNLLPAHLSLLNGSTLHTLKAPIDAQCFEILDDGHSRLEIALPKLHTLSVNRQLDGPINEEVSFASIPSTVTTLTVAAKWTITTLPLLPPAVKKFTHIPFLTVQSCDALVSLFSDPRPPKTLNDSTTSSSTSSSSSVSSTSLPTSSPSTSDPDAVLSGTEIRSLSLTSNYRLERLDASFMNGRTSNVVLVPDSEKTSPVLLMWRNLLALPPTLTALTTDDIQSDLVERITPINLPFLKTLHLGSGELPPSFDVGGFTALRSLRLFTLLASSTLTCPPNLTELISEKSLLLPPGFLPLPVSITHLESRLGELEPLSAIAPLVNLKTLKSKASGNGYRDVLELLPATMTRLDISGDGLDASKYGHLGARCPSLQWLVVRGALHMPQLAQLHQFLPAEAKMKAMKLDVSDVDIIAHHAGIAQGALVIPPDMPIAEWSLGVLGIAFPRRKTHIWAHRVQMSSKQMSSFFKYISPSMLTVSLDWAKEAIPTHDMPRWVTKLLVDSSTVPFSVEAAAGLPPSLKTLIIDDIEPSAVSSLPDGLTSLTCKLIDPPVPPSTDYVDPNTLPPIPLVNFRWPSSLTHLDLLRSSKRYHPELFTTLPPTLVSLVTLSPLPPTWPLLPASLRYLDIPKATLELFNFLTERKVTLVTNENEANTWLRRHHPLLVSVDHDSTV